MLPYKWTTIKVIEGEARYISELEHEYHLLLKDHKYRPEIPFGGQTECFSYSEEVLDLINF